MLGNRPQWLAWRLRLPSICWAAGIRFSLAGPVSGWLDPDAMFGDLLFPLVSLCVGLILFGAASAPVRRTGRRRWHARSLLSVECS